MIDPQTSLVEVVARVTLVYVGLVALVRVAGKRAIGQLAPLDLLALAAITSRLSDRARRLETFLEGRPVVLVERGRLDEAAARRERIGVQDLEIALREHGLRTLFSMHRASVEPDGSISVVAMAEQGR